ncbi:uncharacterized protein MONBRDRAFT_8776 [Monosiga brevicollis MX1]|uniref:Methyltransferase domain-containing protein n=1 Tax=Monosiga brevicollis TaxID=81824 RepID=A9V137_MONBE|nr:uncharacterized protein MONBRDRAFT_8776 [Monosiga brevicollis MX1]EDQ88739.1 predicted protein [Monosiga brevicollis MX1]|eukprot:XP_001746352.1 hypothetical protein [Monosiga brevicollis MX1]
MQAVRAAWRSAPLLGRRATSYAGPSQRRSWLPTAVGVGLGVAATGVLVAGCRTRFDDAPAIHAPLDDPELQQGLEQRERDVVKLHQYMAEMREKFIKLGASEPDDLKRAELYAKFREDVLRDTQAYLDTYGCARWTDSALELIKEFSPIVELGAGQGQWQRALTEAGANVVAFDNESSLQPSNQPVGKVYSGDEQKLGWYPYRTLLLVYPPDSDMAQRALDRYKGRYLIYVGEARGGVNANEEFFDTLEADWDCVHRENLAPFSRCYERLYVFRRAVPVAQSWTAWFLAWM